MKVSWQCAHVTRHIPGTLGRDGLTGEGDKLMILLQLGRGQAIRWEELLQIRRQLHGQRTYFLPGGAFFMGCKVDLKKDMLVTKKPEHISPYSIKLFKHNTPSFTPASPYLLMKGHTTVALTVASLH